MILYLMRHGLAQDRTDPDCPPDPQRRLTPRGVEKTREAALGLRELISPPQVFLSSPYLRAMETAEIVAGVFGYPARKIRQTRHLLPEARPAELFRELAEITEAEVVCLGHAPSLDEALAHAIGVRRMVTALKKAGVACLEMESFAPPRGLLLAVYPPKALRRLAR